MVIDRQLDPDPGSAGSSIVFGLGFNEDYRTGVDLIYLFSDALTDLRAHSADRSMSNEFNFLVNGQVHRVAVDYDQTPLLYILRNDLKLKGARFGCGVGECGACTVLVDGHAERSCEVPAWSVEGKSITTIEGLGTTERMHPLQQAFVDFQAGQCAYCLSGIIMRAAELIDHDGEPSRDKVIAALDRNLCRCGSHARILSAIESAWRELSHRGTK